MGTSNPIFYLSIERNELPDDLSDFSFEDIITFMNSKLENEDLKLYQNSSRNWRHQGAVEEFCRMFDIKGLDFIMDDFRCIEHDELLSIKNALESILDGIQNTKTEFFTRGHYDFVDIGGFYSVDMYKKAIEEAIASVTIKFGGDWHYGYWVDFFSYIKSFIQVVDETLQQNMCLFYWCPKN